MSQFDITRLSGFSKPQKPGLIKNLVGKQFCQLTVIALLGINNDQRAVWLCLCDCGNFQVAPANSLRHGNTKSCGCRRVAVSRAKATSHGQSHTNLYYRWQKLFDRCYNPSNPHYHNYGGRGICVSQEWHSFPAFLADVGLPPTLQHSLDRIDNNGNYEKENVRWATKKDQGGNKRNNHLITVNGETHHMAEWVRRRNIPRSKIHVRLKLGWTPAEALEFQPRQLASKLSKNR